MYDNVAAWMIAGGLRAELDDPRSASHRIAIREARRAGKSEQPGILDRVRSRIWTRTAASPADCVGV